MKTVIIDDITKKYFDEEIASCIGNFDGIHLGHQALINEVIKSHLKHAMITFEPHPIKALIDSNYKTIMNLEAKEEYLKDTLDYLIIIKFSKDFSLITPNEFINFLKLNGIKEIICGSDFHFGFKASGNVDMLKQYFKTKVVSSVYVNNILVKTQAIRSFLIDGRIEDANKLLGRTYSFKGKVMHGKHLGRTIGFPTANLAESDVLLPTPGVYATKTLIDDKLYLSMTNIGHNPTFNHNDEIVIETNIIDFNGDLYGKEIIVYFYKLIRLEQKFASVEALKTELAKNQDFVKKNLQI